MDKVKCDMCDESTEVDVIKVTPWGKLCPTCVQKVAEDEWCLPPGDESDNLKNN